LENAMTYYDTLRVVFEEFLRYGGFPFIHNLRLRGRYLVTYSSAFGSIYYRMPRMWG